MIQVPQIIQDSARSVDFPTAYRQALVYLEQAAKVDEVKNFSDRVAAAATYYKQKNDREAMNWMRRIQLNSAVRLGRILKEIRIRQEAIETAAQAEREEGEARKVVSPQERLNSIYIADMDERVREERINSDRPPSVNALAGLARRMHYPAPPPLTKEQIREAQLNNAKRRICGHIQRLIEISGEFGVKQATDLLMRPVSDEFGNPDWNRHQLKRVSQWLNAIAELNFKRLVGANQTGVNLEQVLPMLNPLQRYTVHQANEYLRQSSATTYSQIKRGELRVIKDGGRTYIPGSEIIRKSTLPGGDK